MKQDLRFIKTEKYLREALFALIEVKPFEKISVTDICREAMCSRNAFYQHYESKEHLLEGVMRDIIADIEKGCEPVVNRMQDISCFESRQYSDQLLTAVAKHRKAIVTLLTHQGAVFLHLLKQQMIRTNRESFKRTATAKWGAFPETYMIYYVSGIIGFIEYWLLETTDSLQEAQEKLYAVSVATSMDMVRHFG